MPINIDIESIAKSADGIRYSAYRAGDAPVGGSNIFSDDFESGTLNGSGGYSWSNAAEAGIDGTSQMSGTYSARVTHDPNVANADPGDTWGEIILDAPASGYDMYTPGKETYFEMDIKIPSNWAVSETVAAGNNSKLLYFDNDYPTNNRNSFGIEMWPNGSADDVYISVNVYDNGAAQGHTHPGETHWGKIVDNADFLSVADRGNTVNLKIYYKHSDAGQDNGILRIQKDDVTLLEFNAFRDLNGSDVYLHEVSHILGYSNWGYDVKTDFYIDNVWISDGGFGA